MAKNFLIGAIGFGIAVLVYKYKPEWLSFGGS